MTLIDLLPYWFDFYARVRRSKRCGEANQITNCPITLKIKKINILRANGGNNILYTN